MGDLKCLQLLQEKILYPKLWAPGGSLWGLMDLVVPLPLHRWPRVSPVGSNQGKWTHGVVGEGLSGPGGALATLPATPLTPVDPPCRNIQGSVSSRVMFFEGEGRGPAGGGTAALPVDSSIPREPRESLDPKSASILTPPGAVPEPTS